MRAAAVFVFVAILICSFGLSSSQVIDDPADKCPADEEIPTYLPHESKCWLFYECSNGEAILNECPPGLYFDPLENVCDTDAACGDLETSTPAVSTSTGSI